MTASRRDKMKGVTLIKGDEMKCEKCEKENVDEMKKELG